MTTSLPPLHVRQATPAAAEPAPASPAPTAAPVPRKAGSFSRAESLHLAKRQPATGAEEPALPPLRVSSASRLEGVGSPDAIAEARAAADVEAQSQLDEWTAPPASPTGYKLPADVRGLSGEEITASREAAFNIGLSPSEFRTVALVLDQANPRSISTDQRILAKHADAMGQDLERRYGVEGAEAIARRAVAAVEGACKSLPQMRPVLRYLLATNRPLLEMLARVGERMERRR
jgi:hypothetical protein